MRLVPVLGAAALTLALSGCSLLGFGTEEPAPEPKKTQATQVAEVDKVLTALTPITGDKDSVPSRTKSASTRRAAGHGSEQREATIDGSPPGNDVPSKMFGVRTDEGCVIGEIRSGKATAELMQPTESTGSCLFGEVERPKGVEAPKGEKRDEDGDSNGAGHLPGENINGEDDPTESPEPAESPEPSEDSSDGGDTSGEAPSLGGG